MRFLLHVKRALIAFCGPSGRQRVYFHYPNNRFAAAPPSLCPLLQTLPILSLSFSESKTLCYSNASVFSFSLSISDVTRAIELLEKLQESGDVPGHKLQSLKKVLQSEFCTAIREVSSIKHCCHHQFSTIFYS